jgi:predicted lipoprotein with Yx(FWY)xxD motif
MLRLGSLAIAAAILIAACSTSGASVPPPTAVSSAPAAASAAAVTIGTAMTSLGTVLTGPTGLTLNTHAGDTATTSTCSGGCLTAWPPLTIASGQQATAGPGVSGQLASFVRPEGMTQVTYSGLPLYYWQGDTKPGDVTGQGIAGFSVAQAAGAPPASGGGASPSAGRGASPSPAGGASPSSSGYGY